MGATTIDSTHDSDARARLLHNYSLEMTAKDADRLDEAADLIPPETLISVTFLPNEDFPARIKAAAAVRRLGWRPVPHISARRLASRAEFEGFVETLAATVAMDRVFCVAGDAADPRGPFEDALALIRTGILPRYGIKRVGVSGYPEGHPDIPTAKLWQALRDKQAEILDQGMDFAIITQFAFDADPIFAWLKRLREEGIDAPVRVGVSGPASAKTLLRYAARCGVGASAKVMAKYGLSITRLLSTAGPDPIIEQLAAGLDPAVHGEVGLQFYPFGGFVKTANWVRDFRLNHGV